MNVVPAVRDRLPAVLLLSSILCGVLLLWLAARPAALFAQSESTSESDPAAISADQVNQVARELWCPLCSGVRLDACELKACDQMKEMIAIKLAEGQDAEAIRSYFVEQYGPQVLGEPPRAGFNWLAWILPFVALLGGGLFFWNRARRLVQPVTVEPRPAPSPITPLPEQDSEQPKDEYEGKLEEELQRYG